MKHLSQIQAEIIIEGLDDYVGLWQVARSVRQEILYHTGGNTRRTSLNELGPLLHKRYITPGQLTEDGGFLGWHLEPIEALERIDREWLELDQDPDISQICWFSNTSKGDELAQAVTKSRSRP
jgi:hypothetical protein